MCIKRRRKKGHKEQFVCLLVGCLTSQQHANVSQGRIYSDKFTCCRTEIEAVDPTFHLTQSQYADTRPTSPSTDPIMPGAWQGSSWSSNFDVTGMTWPRKNPITSGIQTRDPLLEADALTTRPLRQSQRADNSTKWAQSDETWSCGSATCAHSYTCNTNLEQQNSISRQHLKKWRRQVDNVPQVLF